MSNEPIDPNEEEEVPVNPDEAGEQDGGEESEDEHEGTDGDPLHPDPIKP